MTRKTIFTIFAITIVSAGVLGTTHAFAENTTSDTNPMSSLVAKIAAKFNLNQADVQAVFDAQREDRQKQMETEYTNQLTKLVTEGKITESQKQLIITKHAQLEANHQTSKDSMKNMTADERKAAMDKEKQVMQDWATQNGIDLQYLMLGRAGGGHMGHPRSGLQPEVSNATPTQ